METSAETHKLVFSRIGLREPKGRFHGFSSAGIELHAVQRRRRATLGEFFQQLNSRLACETPDGSLFNLCLNRLYVFGMAVTQRIDANAADNIDQRIAIDVGNGAATGFFDGDSRHQSKALQARSQMFIFSFAKLLAFGPWNGRMDERLLVLRLVYRPFHQAYFCRSKTKCR